MGDPCEIPGVATAVKIAMIEMTVISSISENALVRGWRVSEMKGLVFIGSVVFGFSILGKAGPEWIPDSDLDRSWGRHVTGWLLPCVSLVKKAVFEKK